MAHSLHSLTQLSPSTLPLKQELLSNMARKFLNLQGNYLLTVNALLDPRFRKSAVNHLNIKVQKKSSVKKSQKQMLNNPVILQIILLSHLQSSKLPIQSQVAYGPLLIVELQSFLQITTHYSQSLSSIRILISLIYLERKTLCSGGKLMKEYFTFSKKILVYSSHLCT